MSASGRFRVRGAIVAACLAVGCLRSTPTGGSGVSTPADILLALAGEWTGVLEYADYRTNERVQLPTHLTAVFAEGELRLAYAYSEPSGTVVRANNVHRALADGRRYVMGTDTLTVLSMDGFNASAGPAAGARTAILLGTTTENDVVVPARHSIVIRGDSLIIRKDTRDPPQLRNEYRFRRADRTP